MPDFTYTGDDERYYPSLSLEAAPGLVANLPDLPTDGRWVPVGAPMTAPDPVPAVAPEGAA